MNTYYFPIRSKKTVDSLQSPEYQPTMYWYQNLRVNLKNWITEFSDVSSLIESLMFYAMAKNVVILLSVLTLR